MELRSVKYRPMNSRGKFMEKQMKDIHTGRCFVCKRKGCQSRNHDSKERKKVVNCVQIDKTTDITDEDSDVYLEK